MENKKYVKVEKEGSIARIILSNTEAKNLFNYQLVSDFIEALKEQKDNKDIKAVIISSADKEVFSRGYDLAYLSKLQEMGFNENFVDISHLTELYLLILQYPKLIIGKLSGEVHSPATTLLALCDIIFSTQDATWHFFEPKLGIIPGAEIVLLSQLYQGKVIRRLFLNSTPWKSEELVNLNVVDYVVDEENIDKKIKKLLDNYLSGETHTATNLIKRMSLDVHYIADSNHAIQLGMKMHTHSRLSAEAKLMMTLLMNKDVK